MQQAEGMSAASWPASLSPFDVQRSSDWSGVSPTYRASVPRHAAGLTVCRRARQRGKHSDRPGAATAQTTCCAGQQKTPSLWHVRELAEPQTR
jgi:hypothetical protein